MERYIVLTLLALALIQTSYAPPVSPAKNNGTEESEVNALEDYMEYHRYLKEVVSALESDHEFRNKLEKAEESDIRSGKIAEELEFVSHHVRNRLNEIKRIELNRLRELTERQRQLMNNINNEDPSHGHVDHANPHTFEINDLKKLIAKTTEDLAIADQKRKEEFKQYELQKEFEKQNKLNHTDEAEREKLLKEYKESEEKHKKHEKLHEPGHKAQLEEVWEEQDQMQQEFNPKTFFMLHDVDSNGLWDQDEVKALFIKELEKMYKAGEPEDDMRERAEEMERMRESVFKEVDLNRDGFIDYDEFLAQTKRNDFQQDHGWQGIDERRPYTDEELQEYIRQQQAAQMRHGYPPQGYPHQPYPGGHVPPGGYQQVPPGYHPNAVPQQQFHPGQVPQQQFHPGQVPQHHPNAPPQGQFHPGQMPQHPQKLPGQLPDLNTNEIYPPHMQQQHVPPNQPPQGHYQQQNIQQPPQGNYRQPQGSYQQNHPNQANFQQPQQGGYQSNNQQQPPQANYQQNPQQGAYQSNNQNQPPQANYQPNPQQGGYQSNNQPQPPQASYQQNPQQGAYQSNNQPQPSQTNHQQNPQQGGYQSNNQPQPPQTNQQQQNSQQNQPPESPPQVNQEQKEQGHNAAPVPPSSQQQQAIQGNNGTSQGSPQVNHV